MDNCIDDKGQNYLKDIFNHIAHAMGCETPVEAIAFFRQMIVDMDLKNPVSVNREEELLVLSTSVNPVRLKNNPVCLDMNAINTLYERIVL